MAVYTHVNENALSEFLDNYDIGSATALKGIAEGVENSNYLLVTDQSKFILTLYEKRVRKEDLPFFLDLMRHMSMIGLPSAEPVSDRKGNVLKTLCGRPAAVIQFMPGLSVDNPAPEHCAEMGRILACAHLGTANFNRTRTNDLSLSGWQNLAQQCGSDADRCHKGLATALSDEVIFLTANWPDHTNSPLGYGVIHADFFPDNVLFTKEKTISGLIDFYFACSDFYAYDLAICINAWCFDELHQFSIEKARAFLTAYCQKRPLTQEEINTMPVFLRGAALRFLLTRTYDWLNQVDGALVRVKDPLEYWQKLKFHQTNPDAITQNLNTI